MSKTKTEPIDVPVMRALVEITVHRLSDSDPLDFSVSELIERIDTISLSGNDFFVATVTLEDVTALH